MNAPLSRAEAARLAGLQPGRDAGLDHAIERATKAVAPLWPLDSFVAVNPFLGLADRRFAEAADVVADAAGARLVMPRAFYAAAIASGRISDGDLAAALAMAPPITGIPATVAALKAAATTVDEPVAPLPTVADVATTVTGSDWSAFVIDRISRFAASRFDGGQALWSSPLRDEPLYRAWRAEATLDRTPEIMGLAGFRQLARGLPVTAAGAIAAALADLGVPPGGRHRYLHRLLTTISGWAAYARCRGWQAELKGGRDDTLVELLAVRLCWDRLVLQALGRAAPDTPVAAAWIAARRAYAVQTQPSAPRQPADLLLHEAYEIACRRELFGRLRSAKPVPGFAGRPAVQAVFCIDVRSEVFRRAFEAAMPGAETLGFAGFFGFPVEYVRFGDRAGGTRCPVLIPPAAIVCEAVGTNATEEAAALRKIRTARHLAAAWSAFRQAAVSSFSFVETVGLLSAVKLGTRLRPGERVGKPDPDHGAPRLAVGAMAGRATGLSLESRIAMAAGALRGMSLTSGFARLVVLVGHGSQSANNPHAAGLDCGACGGHAGDANARIAAAVLNEPAVRSGLAAEGIAIPADTVFVAALHNTTTDQVTIYDRNRLPKTHAADIDALEDAFARAGNATRRERAARLGLAPAGGLAPALSKRSRDWSEVRPEWGLAGCAAFIAAPRHRTEGADLGGRAFLHSYEWRQDTGFNVLELILSAPMVVASWISLQYYGSTVDNRAFGSGNKVLHNVVARLGVLEGQVGDLRTGLPWQSVHDGDRLVHEPVRLTVLVEAPTHAIDDVIARHATVRHLVENGWVHLFAIGDDGALKRRVGRVWRPEGGMIESSLALAG